MSKVIDSIVSEVIEAAVEREEAETASMIKRDFDESDARIIALRSTRASVFSPASTRAAAVLIRRIAAKAEQAFKLKEALKDYLGDYPHLAELVPDEDLQDGRNWTALVNAVDREAKKGG